MALEPFTTVAARRYQELLANPEQAQRELLGRILGGIAGSPVAQALGLRGDETFEEFLSVPPCDYSFYAPLVQRVLEGDRYVFGMEPVVALSETSGSTGTPKLIPQTAATHRALHDFVQKVVGFHRISIQATTASMNPWLLITASSHQRIENGLPIGFISGQMYCGAQTVGQRLFLPSPEIASLTDWEERARHTAAEALTQPIEAIFGVPAYLLQLLREASLQAGGRPLGEIWPHLNRIYYSGTRFDERQRAEIAAFLGRSVMLRSLYAATEGVFGAELDADMGGEMRLLADLAVFTFHDIESNSGQLLPLWELEPGRRYELLVTTPAGLCQYRIGDIVEVTETAPLRIRIAGRVGDEINLATEKLSGRQAERVLSMMSSAAGVAADRFMVLPDPIHPRRHLWLLESLDSRVESDDIDCLVDQTLASLNPSYAALRTGAAILAAPRVVILPPRAFDAYVAAGIARHGQFKFRHLFASADQLLAQAGTQVIANAMEAGR